MFLLDFLHAFFRIIIPPVFTVRIRKDSVTCVQGKIVQKTLIAFKELAKKEKIKKGSIYGIQQKAGLSMKFSSGIPKECYQKFRNVWYASRV